MQGAVIASTASTIPYRHNHPPPLAHGRAAPDRAARQIAFSFSAIAALPPLGLLRHKEHADFVRSQFDFWKDLLDEGTEGHPPQFYDEGRSSSASGAVNSPSRKHARTGRPCEGCRILPLRPLAGFPRPPARRHKERSATTPRGACPTRAISSVTSRPLQAPKLSASG